MTYDNNRLAEMYQQTYYTHRGDGTHKAVHAIRGTEVQFYTYFAQHGSLDGVRFKGINPQVKTNIEQLLRQQ